MARNSQARLPCWRAVSRARRKHSSAVGFVVGFGQVQFAAQAVQLGFLEAFVVLFHEGECIFESAPGGLVASGPGQGFAQDAEIVWQAEGGVRGAISIESLLKQRQAFLQMPAEEQAGGRVKRAGGVPEDETLLDGDAHLLAARGLRLRAKPAVLMEPAGVMQGVFQAEGMMQGARELAGFAVEGEGAFREAEMP